ncbi:tRNA 5-methylaminomethyl-2-thiouridine biosynthesis bifunctional protein [Halospina denitrificans]|uniref:tRNA 5-methylaminomethyl-2-thiouridine biosynthesis bifunctional protein n=1 Tax=Halospina denitrificans TaxID=332522 RepID=A0A4R7JVX8_9GAMM|nr:FAD-dependent 5-carboxymethylaminomethyl-2-thiouridine(34) oxidoreductase MnmC [Halospina denitrificans]TDT41593.1 tRNA 5-methylaminomethyl-2-thiouridine biosynthesis bifunctional protein [Halospina denitrificans]
MVQRQEASYPLQVVVIGAGIAGTLAARALAERSMDVAVIEPDLPREGQDPARRGALYVKPAVEYSPETRFAHQAFLHAAEYYSWLQSQHPGSGFWYQTGTLQVAWNEREAERQEKLIARNDYSPDFLQPVSRDTASQLAGIDVPGGGLWFPRGGHLFHSGMRRAALDHPRIRTVQAKVTGRPVKSQTTGNWQVPIDTDAALETRHIVVAAGASTADWFPQLPLGRIRGQITRINAVEPALRATISGAGYALPPLDGAQSIGATFDRDCQDPQVRDESHRLNLQTLNDWFPTLGSRFHSTDIKDGWVGFRSTTPDHMPITGVCDGLHLIAGLGGKGLAYAPILAQEVAHSICGQPSILDPDLGNRVSPKRFL